MTETLPDDRHRDRFPFASVAARWFLAFGLAVVSIHCGSGVSAQTTAEKDPTLVQLQETVDGLFANLKSPQVTPEAALAEFLTGGPLAASEQHKALAEKYRSLQERFGKVVGVEKIDAKRVGNDLVLLKYLNKFETYPVVWYFAFYRDFKHPSGAAEAGNWVLISVRFDTRLELLWLP